LAAHVTDSLDECAPIKTVKIRYQRKFGSLDKTKVLITERDLTRKKMSAVSGAEKVVQHSKYELLRNRVNSEFRKIQLTTTMTELTRLRMKMIYGK
jgi:hypothetical protein